MTDLSYVRYLGAARSRRVPWTVVLYGAVLLAGTAGVLVAVRTGDKSGSMEWQLSLLLRFMALVKAAMVVGALGLAHWRLRAPIDIATACGLVVATATMALAPGLIWSPPHIILGAACFHAGLLAYLVIAWRDGGMRLSARRL